MATAAAGSPTPANEFGAYGASYQGGGSGNRSTSPLGGGPRCEEALDYFPSFLVTEIDLYKHVRIGPMDYAADHPLIRLPWPWEMIRGDQGPMRVAKLVVGFDQVPRASKLFADDHEFAPWHELNVELSPVHFRSSRTRVRLTLDRASETRALHTPSATHSHAVRLRRP